MIEHLASLNRFVQFQFRTHSYSQLQSLTRVLTIRFFVRPKFCQNVQNCCSSCFFFTWLVVFYYIAGKSTIGSIALCIFLKNIILRAFGKIDLNLENDCNVRWWYLHVQHSNFIQQSHLINWCIFTMYQLIIFAFDICQRSTSDSYVHVIVDSMQWYSSQPFWAMFICTPMHCNWFFQSVHCCEHCTLQTIYCLLLIFNQWSIARCEMTEGGGYGDGRKRNLKYAKEKFLKHTRMQS